MNEFVTAIVDDLRAFCSDLLEAGLAPATTPLAPIERTGGATFAMVLRRIESVTTFVPRLIDSLDTSESLQRFETVPRRTPVGASMPRSPVGWAVVEGRALPRWWERATATLEVDPTPLGFVKFVLDRLGAEFSDVRNRLRRHISDARTSRQGTSRFAREDLNKLDSLDARLDRAEARLSRATQLVQQVTAGRVHPTDRLPHPFPRAPEWTSFRRLADSILRPEQFLADTVAHWLQDQPASTDLPFLYQRWVGTRLVHELTESFHFALLCDPVGPLFLGGCISLRREATTIQLWSEPRLSQREHASGLAAEGFEATPDFLFVTPGHGGPDAFVLDATMSHDPTILESKSRYRERICFTQFRPQAGVPGRRRPLRAWAAVPLAHATHNQLSRPDGSAGLVPMQPEGFLRTPLRAWLADIVDHADAWQRFTPLAPRAT